MGLGSPGAPWMGSCFSIACPQLALSPGAPGDFSSTQIPLREHVALFPLTMPPPSTKVTACLQSLMQQELSTSKCQHMPDLGMDRLLSQGAEDRDMSAAQPSPSKRAQRSD